ncbi:hypothetical protein Tco_0995777 [Tanacetum coccineum]
MTLEQKKPSHYLASNPSTIHRLNLCFLRLDLLLSLSNELIQPLQLSPRSLPVIPKIHQSCVGLFAYPVYKTTVLGNLLRLEETHETINIGDLCGVEYASEPCGGERKMENLNEVRIKEIRSDNGTEFRNNKLEEFCDEKAKAIRVFNIRRQELEESFHVTFSEDDEAISQSSTKGMSEHFPYIPTYDPLSTNNIIPETINSTDSHITQDPVPTNETPESTTSDDHPFINTHESEDNPKPTEV